MKSKLLLLAPLVLLPYSINSMAVSIMFRHQYIDNKTNEDRIEINHRFKNHIGLTLQDNFISGASDHKDSAGKPFTEIGNKDTKLAINYQYKPVSNFYVQPGFNMVFSSSKYSYQPEVKFQYNLTKDLFVAFRYRYEYARSTKKATANDNINREDIWLGYNIGKVGFTYNYMYRRGEHVRANQSNGEFWNNLQISYKITKNWKPFVEVGNVADTSNKKGHGGRQTRYRVGLTYTF